MRIADTSADAYSTYVEFMRTYAAHIPQPHVQPYSFFLNPESLAGCGQSCLILHKLRVKSMYVGNQIVYMIY